MLQSCLLSVSKLDVCVYVCVYRIFYTPKLFLGGSYYILPYLTSENSDRTYHIWKGKPIPYAIQHHSQFESIVLTVSLILIKQQLFI